MIAPMIYECVGETSLFLARILVYFIENNCNFNCLIADE